MVVFIKDIHITLLRLLIHGRSTQSTTYITNSTSLIDLPFMSTCHVWTAFTVHVSVWFV